MTWARRFGFALVAAALVLPGVAAQSTLLSEFKFDRLAFTYYPDGLGSNGPEGSTGLEVFAQAVRVEGAQAVELRHCIDGWARPQCSYGDQLAIIYKANHDSEVTTDEVDKFEAIAPFAVQQLSRVKRLSSTLQNNVTLDGLTSTTPRVTVVAIAGAEGNVDSSETILIDVTVEAHYANDRKAKRHEMHIASFHLKAEKFTYNTIRFNVQSTKTWEFVGAETLPEGLRAFTTPTAYESPQDDFEAASDAPIRLVMAQPTKGGSSDASFPWLWVGVGGLLVLIAIAAVIIIRRRA